MGNVRLGSLVVTSMIVWPKFRRLFGAVLAQVHEGYVLKRFMRILCSHWDDFVGIHLFMDTVTALWGEASYV